MATHRRGNNGKEGRNKRVAPEKDNCDELISSSSSTNNCTDLLVWLRGLALEPVNAEIRTESDYELRDRMLNFRKVLLFNNPECRRSKRKAERLRSDPKFFAASGMSSEKSADSNIQKKRRRLLDSDSCLPSESSSPQTVCSSNPSSPREKNGNESGSDGKFLKLVFAEDESVRRPVIPIGPGFQAELPDCKGAMKKANPCGGASKTLKWLRTKTWPVQSRKNKPIEIETGKGRPDSCSCDSPGSADCIRQHIYEARQQLRSELGTVFLTWKFDEMGEVVSDSWTAKEEQRFESLVKKNPFSSSKRFWEIASKSFSSRSKKSLLSYYYNVFLIKRIRLLTKSSVDKVESDDDNNADHFRAG